MTERLYRGNAYQSVAVALLLLADPRIAKRPEAPTQLVRVFLMASGKEPQLPNRRHLSSYEEIVAFYGTSQGSQHSLKLAKHDAKTGRWALMDRVSDGFRAGRASYLKAGAKQAA